MTKPLIHFKFHCFRHMFWGRIRNALSLRRAGLGECRCKGADGAGWFWHDSQSVTLRHSNGRSMEWAHCNHTLTFVPCLMNSWLLVGNFGDMCLWRYLRLLHRFSSSFSCLLWQGAFYDNRIFYSVGNLFPPLLLLPPPDVLICSLRGHRQL